MIDSLVETMRHVIGLSGLSSMEAQFVFTSLSELVEVSTTTTESKKLISEIILTTLPLRGIELRSHDKLISNLNSYDTKFIKSLFDKADTFYLEHALLSQTLPLFTMQTVGRTALSQIA